MKQNEKYFSPEIKDGKAFYRLCFAYGFSNVDKRNLNIKATKRAVTVSGKVYNSGEMEKEMLLIGKDEEEKEKVLFIDIDASKVKKDGTKLEKVTQTTVSETYSRDEYLKANYPNAMNFFPQMNTFPCEFKSYEIKVDGEFKITSPPAGKKTVEIDGTFEKKFSVMLKENINPKKLKAVFSADGFLEIKYPIG